jgi:two-component system, NtrC family, sensor kinase
MKQTDPANILILDDEQFILDLLREILEPNGYRCACAAGAGEARKLMEILNFDLVLCDINMPGESGLDFCRFLLSAHPDTAMVMVTGIEDPLVAKDALDIGVYDYLLKPIERNRVLISVANALHRCRLEAENRNYKERLEELVKCRTAMLENAVRELEHTEQALQQSESKFRELVENANSFIIRFDGQGRITFFNEYAQQFFGYTEKEILGQNVVGTITPTTESDGRDLSGLIGDICRDPEKYSINENENVTRCGQRVWVAWTNKAVYDENGQIVEILSVGQDITQRKKAVQALHRNFDFLQQLIDTIPNPIFYKDINGIYQLCNTAFEQSIGLSRKDIVGKTIYDLAPKEQADTYNEIDRELIRKPGTRSYESRIRYADGRIHDVIFYNASITGSPGTATGIVGVMLDITERKEAEQEHVHLAAAISQADEMIVVTDPEGSIQYVNPAFEKYTGYSRREAMGQTPRILKSGQQAGEFYKSLWETIRSGRVWSGRLVNRKKDGTLFEEEARISPIRSPSGEIVNYVAVKRDVTKEHYLEIQLRQAQRMEAIGTLAGGIAHEINTPIQYVLYNTNFLQEKFRELNTLFDKIQELIQTTESGETQAAISEEIKEVIERIDLGFIREEIPPAIEQTLEGAQRVVEIVRAMKEFSHPGSDEKTMVDLNKSIQSTITVARNEWKYVAEVATDFDADLPLVPCLPGDFNQVILNLIVNAAHAIADVVGDGAEEKGLISIRTCRNKGWVEIRVSDTGTGIAEKNRGRIFDPFFTTKEVGRGTGQGLAICHAVIAEKHGGEISFETETGKGTTFLIQLPLEEKSA